MNLTAVFTAPPEFTVLNGRSEIGRTDPDLLTEEIEGPRKLLLAGRNWLVTYIDWRRKRCFVEPTDGGGRARWNGFGADRIRSFALTRAARDVLLGEDPPVRLTKRATAQLAEARDTYLHSVHPGGTVITRHTDGDIRWWTWAGHRANATLAASMASVVAPRRRVNDQWIKLREDLTSEGWQVALTGTGTGLCLPEVDGSAVRGLKFGEALRPAWPKPPSPHVPGTRREPARSLLSPCVLSCSPVSSHRRSPSFLRRARAGVGRFDDAFGRWGDFPRGAISRRVRICLNFLQS